MINVITWNMIMYNAALNRCMRMDERIRIDVPKSKIKSFCRRHNIRKLSFFGSVLRDDFGPESDVDVLVEFEPDEVVGYLKLVDMQMELSEILGRKVDLRTPAEISPFIRQRLFKTLEVAYVQG